MLVKFTPYLTSALIFYKFVNTIFGDFLFLKICNKILLLKHIIPNNLQNVNALLHFSHLNSTIDWKIKRN